MASTLDVNALRLFQATWQPVLDSIPVVLQMVGQQADLERELKQKAIALQNAHKEIDAAYEEADRRLKSVNDQMDASMMQKTVVEAAISQAQADAQQAADEAAQRQNEVLAAIALQISAKNAELSAVDQELASKKAAAESEHAALLAQMSQEVAELEKRQAIAEKALESLRAKLG